MLDMLDKPAKTAPNTLNVNEIMAVIPHRYPFLLVDRVTEHVPGDYIKGYKNITINEPFFNGHFPENPIMPGVLIVEALAQLGCIMVAHMDEGKDKLTLFAGINDIRFRRPVLPGDKLELEAILTKLRSPIGKATVKALVDGEIACEGEILFSLMPKDKKITDYA